MLAAASVFSALMAPAPASASERPLTLQAGGGVRIFNSQLALHDNVSLGLRMGLGMTDRLSLALDYVFSSPVRETSNYIAYVSALRGLIRFDLLAGRTRPYLIAGLGGVQFNFNDARDYSTGTLTVGYGLSRRIGPRRTLGLEATADVYRNRVEQFSVTGDLIGYGPRSYQGMGTISASVGIEF